jgi:hypothetical protein
MLVVAEDQNILVDPQIVVEVLVDKAAVEMVAEQMKLIFQSDQELLIEVVLEEELIVQLVPQVVKEL